MRKLQMKMSMSINGFVAGINGKTDRIFKTGDQDSKAWALGQTENAGLIIMGRKSFEAMVFNGLAKPDYLKLTDVRAFPGDTVAHIYSA